MHGHYDGFLYLKSDVVGETTYRKCRKKNQCTARLITTSTGGKPEKHSHAPNPEEVEAHNDFAKLLPVTPFYFTIHVTMMNTMNLIVEF